MPEICRFFGIIVRMFAEPGTPHHRPHFHAYYQNHVAVISINTVELIGGNLPQKESRLVEAWAELHMGELLENWERLQSGQLPYKIAPLR
jgi:hypothetical protein